MMVETTRQKAGSAIKKGLIFVSLVACFFAVAAPTPRVTIPPLIVEELDGTPSVKGTWKLKVTNGTLTQSGGTATLDLSGAGGGVGLGLADPNADRIYFWDDAPGANAFLAPGNSVAITGTTLDTIQDIRTSASPSFTGLTVSDITLGSIPFAGTGGLISQDNTNLFWDNTNKNLLLGAPTTRGARLVVKANADNVLTGTTTVNASTTVTGVGTLFLTELGVGDRISVSSAAATYATVTAIASNTSLTVSANLGNGTSQTINAKHAIWRVLDSSGALVAVQNDLGHLALNNGYISGLYSDISGNIPNRAIDFSSTAITKYSQAGVVNFQHAYRNVEIGAASYGGAAPLGEIKLYTTNASAQPINASYLALAITQAGNILTGGLTAAGTNAAKVLSFGGPATAPTTRPTDAMTVYPLDVAGAGTMGLAWMSEDNGVGIIGSNNGFGTVTPDGKLHVVGRTSLFGPGALQYVNIGASSSEYSSIGNNVVYSTATPNTYTYRGTDKAALIRFGSNNPIGMQFLVAPSGTAGNAISFVTAATIDTSGNVGIGEPTPQQLVELAQVETITGAVTDGYSAALRLDPGYTAATAQTVSRHNYVDYQTPSNAGAGPSAVTDAAVARFDAAAGTHKATVGATTKTTPTAVQAWLKININGTLHYVPAYTSTTD